MRAWQNWVISARTAAGCGTPSRPDPTPEPVRGLRAQLYEGVTFACELARRGVLRARPRRVPLGQQAFPPELFTDSAGPAAYNAAARGHEHLVAKYCAVLGTSLAGVVAFEDRVAARYLRSRTDLVEGPIGCIGLSGGGFRAAQRTSGWPPVPAGRVARVLRR